MKLTFGKTLASVSKDRNLSTTDQAHLKRWADDAYANDSSWERLSNAARELGLLPANAICESIIREALYIRHYAERVRSGIDFELRERQNQRERLLALARNADDLAEYYKSAAGYTGIANFFKRFLSPVAVLEALHRREAELLRQRAGRSPISAARVSRVDRRGKRKGLRKVTAFIDFTAAFIRTWISETPDYEAIAVLTDIAFPGYDVDAEHVRKALQPTQKSGRKARRALALKKSSRVRGH